MAGERYLAQVVAVDHASFMTAPALLVQVQPWLRFHGALVPEQPPHT